MGRGPGAEAQAVPLLSALPDAAAAYLLFATPIISMTQGHAATLGVFFSALRTTVIFI